MGGQNKKQKTKTMSLMIRKYAFIVVAALSVGLVFAPYAADAAGLVPCGGKGEPRCTLCHMIVGMQGLMKWGMGVAFIAGVAVFTFAGVLYIVYGGDSGRIEMAKGAMKNTAIGIVVMVSAWLIINYGMLLLGVNSGIVGSWYKFDATCTVAPTP